MGDHRHKAKCTQDHDDCHRDQHFRHRKTVIVPILSSHLTLRNIISGSPNPAGKAVLLQMLFFSDLVMYADDSFLHHLIVFSAIFYLDL